MNERLSINKVMKAYEFIDESTITESSWIANGVRSELEEKGYEFLGSGVDQMAFLEPGTGYVLKIFGTQNYIKWQPTKFSKDHKMFFTWAKFCMKNPNNKFLPKFFGFDSFVYNGGNYLQIRQEHLTESGELGLLLWQLGLYLERGFSVNSVLESEARTLDNTVDKAVAIMGSKEDLVAYLSTVRALMDIGKRRWNWDLHRGNIMMRGDTPVILDPWTL